MSATLLGGGETLHVVGESRRQDEIWFLAGGRKTGRVRVPIHAVLVAETDNPHDPNAISVWVNGLQVGFLSREDAARYRSGLERLQEEERRPIALEGVIVGEETLGVFLKHDPSDFGLKSESNPTPDGQLRTGLSGAIATDGKDDSYDLSWMDDLPDDRVRRIAKLRELLEVDPDPIDRHFMFTELEAALYKCRDVFSSALEEYDAVCEQHHAEVVESIRPALVTKFNKIPMIDTYRQAAIRCQKNGDFQAALRWVNRGLEIYGDDCARPEVIADLRNRQDKYKARLRPPTTKTQGPSAPTSVRSEFELLVCYRCGREWERRVQRGRKPNACPDCV